jgi:hypothetical protein
MGGCNGCVTKVHDLTIHDTTSAVAYIPAASGDNGLQIYHVYGYNYNGGVNIAGSSASNILSGASIHDNYLGSAANWDAVGCPYHHDGVHVWSRETTEAVLLEQFSLRATLETRTFTITYF